jgi:hypothetical protein
LQQHLQEFQSLQRERAFSLDAIISTSLSCMHSTFYTGTMVKILKIFFGLLPNSIVYPPLD